MQDEWLQILSDLRAAGAAFVSVTLVQTVGSAPADPGAKLLADASGLRAGSVGGGRVEARALDVARAMLDDPASPRTALVNWNLQTDIGMTCGGAVTLFFERSPGHAWHVAVFGAGHVAQALVRTLLNLECRVTCLDPRPEWVARLPEHPRLTRAVEPDLAGRVDALPCATQAVVMTQGHSTDLPVLVRLLSRDPPLPYVGVIGSLAKRRKLIAGLIAAGIGADRAEAFHCPVGLPIGSNHPWEIAISVTAQLLQERDVAAVSTPAPSDAPSSSGTAPARPT